MTKPGNSDRDEPETVESASEPKPEPAEVEPLMAELEKAPPPPKEPVRKARPRAEEPVAPGVLRYAFYLFLLAAVVALVAGIDLLLKKQEAIDVLVKANKNPDITDAQIASSINTLLWLLMIVNVTFAAFFALCGYKAQEGVRKARILLTVISIIVVLLYFLVLRITAIGMLSGFVALIATLLLYLPSATAYFRRHEVR